MVDHVGALSPSPCKKPRLNSSVHFSDKTNSLLSDKRIKEQTTPIKMVREAFIFVFIGKEHF